MDVTLITVLGMTASILSTVSLLPQVMRTWRSRSAGDISALWLVVALASMMLWISYGALLGAQAVVWANVLTAVQAGFILAIKLTEGRKRPSDFHRHLASTRSQASSGPGSRPV